MIFRQARPDLPSPILTEPSFAFPSGHATVATAVYGALAVLLLRSRLPPAVRIGGALVLGALVAAVALSRVYVGVHSVADVAGGVCLGLAWLSACVASLRARGGAQRRRRRGRDSPFALRNAS